MLQTNWRKLHVRATINIFSEYFRAKNRITKLSQAEILWLSRHTKNSMLGSETRQNHGNMRTQAREFCSFVHETLGKKKQGEIYNKSKNRKVNLMSIKTSVNFLVFSQLYCGCLEGFSENYKWPLHENEQNLNQRSVMSNTRFFIPVRVGFFHSGWTLPLIYFFIFVLYFKD